MGRTKKRSRKKSSKQVAQLATLMRGIDFCMMTTHGTDNVMRSRPMSNNGEVEFDGDAWFFTSRDSRKVAEIESDSRVELSYVGGTKRAPIWISLAGTAEILDDNDLKEELWLDELEQWFDNGPDDPEVVLIHVKAEQAAWWTYEDQGELKL
jgi:general stress protein 26